MPLSRLSFVARRPDDRLDLWSVTESGIYVRDNQIGRAHADELILAMAHMTNLALLSQVGHAIVARGMFGGIEAGFSQRIAEHLIPAA